MATDYHVPLLPDDTDPGAIPDGTVPVYSTATQRWVPQVVSGGGTGGATDHGLLTGLGDDDHPQYLNNARGDARYYTKGTVDSALDGKASTAHTHDDRYYTETEVNAALAGKANTTHQHPVTDLTATGTPSATTYLRGDGAWATPAGGVGGGGAAQPATGNTGGGGLPGRPYIGTSDWALINGETLFTFFHTPDPITVQALTAGFYSVTGTTGKVDVALYAAPTMDSFGALVMSLGSVPIADNFVASTLAAPVAVPAGSYWLAQRTAKGDVTAGTGRARRLPALIGNPSSNFANANEWKMTIAPPTWPTNITPSRTETNINDADKQRVALRWTA